MLKLAIPFLLLMNLGEPRVPSETNQAPDVVLRDSETAPAAAKPTAATEFMKPTDSEASAAAAKIKSLNAKVFEAKIAITQANGQVDALKSRLDRSQNELDKIWNDRLDLDIKLTSVRAQKENALAEIKRLTDEKEQDARRYEELSAWNRKLFAMHYLIILLIPLGFLLHFALRRQVAGILARVPDEDTTDTINMLRAELGATKLRLIDANDRINAQSIVFDQENAARTALMSENEELRQLLAGHQSDIRRLIALQQGSEATIGGLQKELAEAHALLETMPTPPPQFLEIPVPMTSGELHTDQEVVAAANKVIDILEASRGAMHEPVPEPVDRAEEPTKPIVSDPPPNTDDRHE